MTTICLQAGHENIANNCFADMRSGTGAPGEAIWTPLIRNRVRDLLVAHGFKVVIVDANVNCNGPHGPFDLTLAIHYQSSNPQNTTSGFGVYVPDASVDQVSPRSVTLMKSLRTIYGLRTKLADYSSPRLNHTGEAAHPTWENPNTLFYYLWQTQLGPLGLIECGVGALGARDHVLLWNTPAIVASAIAEGICAAFNVPFVKPSPPPPPAPIPVPVPFPPPVPVPEPPPVPTPVPPAPVPGPVPKPPADLWPWLQAVLDFLKGLFGGSKPTA